MEKQKVIVYVDGFNFYYGLKHDVHWKRYYWLDMVKFFEMGLKENQELVAVKYFSAIPDDEGGDRHRLLSLACYAALYPDINTGRGLAACMLCQQVAESKTMGKRGRGNACIGGHGSAG